MSVLFRMLLSSKYLAFLLVTVGAAFCACAAHPGRILQLEAGGPSSHEPPRSRDGARDNTIFTEGFLRPDDELYFDYPVDAEAEIDDIVSDEITFVHLVGNFTYVEVVELGESQNATASIVEGGLSCRYLTVYLQSQLSRGFNVTILIYGSPYIRDTYSIKEMSLEDFLNVKRDDDCEEI